MKALRQPSIGFTLVELLIVIVVIGILAAITLVAYNGVQARARDSARSQAVADIQHALAAYFAVYGTYPSAIPASGTNVPSGFSGVWGSGSGYTYSVDTAGNWLVNLTKTPDGSAPILSRVPVDPANDNNHYFAYYATSGIGACPQPFYTLTVVGYENQSDIPSTSHEVNCTQGTTTADWTVQSGRAVFSNISGQ